MQSEEAGYLAGDKFSEILKELTTLSIEMNNAVQLKDIPKIEEVHLRKQKLIGMLNLLITAQKKPK